jgi:hypothetical protein
MEIEHLSFKKPETKPQENVLDKALCMSLTFRCLGVTRKVSKDLVSAQGADPKFYNVTKKLFEADSFTNIKKHYALLKKQLCKPGRSIPFPLKEGVFLIPSSNLEEVDNLVMTAKEELPALVNTFVDNDYDTAIGEAREKLGPLFVAEQYPSKEAVRLAFAIEKHYLSFSTPEKLKEISLSLYQKEFDRIRGDVEAAAVSIQNDIRIRMAELVNHMVDKLQLGEDGRPKRFKAASLNNLKEFLDGFRHINITDDIALAAEVEKAKALTNGISTEAIKSDDGIREQFTQGLEALKSNLNTMLENIPTRRFKMFDLGTESTTE